MALGFIKKVFTFGKEKPAETPAAPPELTAEEKSAILAESEPKGRDEDLPIAEDPVLAEEMATAGGSAVDLEADQDEPDASELTITAATDLSMVPLELLEAEEAVEQDLGGGDTEPTPPPTPTFHENPVQPADISQGVIADAVDPTETPIAVALPKGFSAAETAPPPIDVVPQVKQTWFQRLTAGLFRTSSQLTGQITALFTKRKLDDETLEELEDLLIQADLGVETALRVTDTLASERYGKDVTGEDVTKIMATEIVKVLKPVAKPLALDLSHKPHVILVVGVNGTGKTTTIGKLAAKLSGSGLKVMLAAGDTFRAAAIEQLKIWADRTGSTFIGTKLGADAAGLAYEAFEKAKAEKSDVLIIDTAGRLQNKTELMAELEKIVRVLGKLDPDAPHTVLQTLDATTGQNALQQVEIFRNVAGVNGLIMTKLDGTARGGILVAIAAKHKLPVYFIGVGEGIDDLEPFEAEDFASAIAGIAR
ncbi:signal recognition particle-docking protein FtsY [Rhizobium rosettiformans]|uniref:Signal recognition particle receptor FtsY n=1 Tax=Rhizobium rosettiformans TaxID=1368430 RepID=A0ABX7ERK8_9HYPH|nr:signal recognition particle-docking protein FtsY [Rhizobium rosettiformans]QRF50984.1 signal recognition particle-docking protein FtsY [Rhizobium rosettiformans]